MIKNRIIKKRKAKTPIQKAFDACEKAMYDAVKRRDGMKCVLCPSTEIIQCHHAIISRKHKSTFFEMRQCTTLCRKCHSATTWQNFGTDVKAAAIVAEREGMSFIEFLFERSRQIKKWSLTELENMKADFETGWRS